MLGAGAVGSYFGAMLARAGSDVTLIGRTAHVNRVRAAGLTIERADGVEQIKIAADDAPAALGNADIILVCVKSFDTEAAARQIDQYARRDAIVVSMQNGVTNAERIRVIANVEALAAVVYVAVDLTAPGHVRYSGRGDLVIGGVHTSDSPYRSAALQQVADLFNRAGVACRISTDIAGELWRKLIINCVYNAISALTGAHYGRLIADERMRELMQRIVSECIAVARAEAVAIDESRIRADVLALASAMPQATSSMLQDRLRGRRTETDALNGHVALRAAAHQIDAPLNAALHALMRLV